MSYALALPLYLVIKGIYLPVSRSKRLSFLKRGLFYFEYLSWLGRYCGLRETALVIFDHLVPEIAQYIPREEFAQWFANSRFDDVHISSKAGNSWRGFGRRVTP